MMKYLKIYKLFFLAMGFCGCSSQHVTTTYRNYNDYYIKEVFYNPKKGPVTSYQVYLVDSFFKKGERLYFSDHIYHYRKGDTFILKHDRVNKRYSGYHSCQCAGKCLNLNKSDSVFIYLIKELIDSLNWQKPQPLNEINGFQTTSKK